MTNADWKANIRFLSHWGNMCVWKDGNGDVVALTDSEGKKVTGKRGTTADNIPVEKEPKQIDFFDASHDYSIQLNANTNIFMSPRERQRGERTPKTDTPMD